MNRNAVALVAGALAGAAAALLLRQRRAGGELDAPRYPSMDEAREELREKLAQARQTAPDENDFEVAGMGAETMVTEEARPPEEPPPSDEFEAMRRRIHEEGRAAAEEMRRRAEPGDR